MDVNKVGKRTMHSFRRSPVQSIPLKKKGHLPSFLMSPSEALALKEQGNVLFKSSQFEQ